MKTRSFIMVVMVMIFIAVIAAPANASKLLSRKVVNIDKLTQVVIDVTEPSIPSRASSSNGTWVPRDAKCVVKYWDDPAHLILDLKFTVKKHWEFNRTLNKVRRVKCSAGDCWINTTLKTAGANAETYDAMDYLYTLPDKGTGHYSERHAKFHIKIGVKGFSIPVATWEVNVWFKVFSKNRPGTNQNWWCKVTKKWHYGSGS